MCVVLKVLVHAASGFVENNDNDSACALHVAGLPHPAAVVKHTFGLPACRPAGSVPPRAGRHGGAHAAAAAARGAAAARLHLRRRVPRRPQGDLHRGRSPRRVRLGTAVGNAHKEERKSRGV